MSKQFFVDKVDYVSEAMRLLVHLGTGETFGEFKKELVRKYNVGSEAFNEKFRILIDIEKRAQKVLKGQEEELQNYFSNSREAGKDFGRMAVLWEEFSAVPYESIDALKQELEGLSQEEYCKRYSELLYGYVSQIQDDWAQPFCDNPMDVIRFLMGMDIPDEEKWKLQQIFLKPEEHREKVFRLLESAMEALKDYSEELDKLAVEFAVYWEKKLAGRNMREYINERIGFELEENPLGFSMRPCLFYPSAIQLYAKVEEDVSLSTPYIFSVGILFDDNFVISFTGKDTRENQEYALKVLKILSDSSKFEILSYIKDKSAYGSQLAKHLGLTTATISHHMSALLSAGLVTMETKDAKVYYRGNVKAIEEVLEYCKQVLA